MGAKTLRGGSIPCPRYGCHRHIGRRQMAAHQAAHDLSHAKGERDWKRLVEWVVTQAIGPRTEGGRDAE